MLERLVALPGREDGLPQRAATLLAELNAKGAEP
jgi:hypothetical protein